MRVRLSYDDSKRVQPVITNAETGEPIEYVSAVRFDLDAHQPLTPRTTVDFWPQSIELVTDAEMRKVCPMCGNVTAAIYEIAATIAEQYGVVPGMEQHAGKEIADAIRRLKA